VKIVNSAVSKPEPDTGGRAIAAMLALIWIGAGPCSIYLGAVRAALDLTVLGTIATCCGMLWLRVAWTGRGIEWPLGKARRAKPIEVSGVR
jgi:hypothetical protein